MGWRVIGLPAIACAIHRGDGRAEEAHHLMTRLLLLMRRRRISGALCSLKKNNSGDRFLQGRAELAAAWRRNDAGVVWYGCPTRVHHATKIKAPLQG